MADKYRNLILFSVFLLAGFLIVFRFLETPSVWLDEGIFTESIKNYTLDGRLGIQVAPGKIVSTAIWATSGYPLFLPVALSFALFDVGFLQARLPMLIYMFFLTVLFYLFVKKIGGFYPAVAAVLLLVSFSPFYGNGRPVLGEVPGLVFLVLGALLFLYLERSNFQSKLLALFSGASFGLAASAKPLYLMIIMPTLALSLIIFQNRINPKRILLIFFLGLFLPVVIWIFTQFPSSKSFFDAISVYSFGNPDASANEFELIRANLSRFFKESTPILFLILLAVNILSYLIKAGKKAKNYTIAEIIILFFAILNWLAYLKGPGWYRHFFPGHVLLYLILPGSVLSLRDYFSNKLIKKFAVIAICLLIALQFYHLIFLSQTSFAERRSANAQLSSALSGIGAGEKVFFLDTIEAAVFLKGRNYSAHLTPTDFYSFGEKEFGNLLTYCDADYVLLKRREIEKYNPLLSCYNIKDPDGGGHYLFLVKK